ncbi:MFS superfamily sulfate permease-like transporter [Fusobacterium sp. PH5-7]|uniref:hypothetical protein n=1 Tax=Fusobacterium sp. PH5-7 TaxID=2940528 RepID=UPI00247319F5|nr:hypothetical protein [Fusobacterium sp. PH5-7]MDH6456903.1 MFS superfamily sulfate permease-like transporter [Fusobacterium sp. PH5-7]
MEIKIDDSKKDYIFKPKNTAEEITQNIENILARTKENVVLARHKGIVSENVDKPQIIVAAEIIADITEEIDREEKRFKVNEVELKSQNQIGTSLIADVKGEIIGD